MNGCQNIFLSFILFLFVITSIDLTLGTLQDNTQQDELKLVHVIWRHGDRNPEWAYPNDPYSNPSYWPEGFGELTHDGVMQQRELGDFLRKRYDGFIQKKFDPKEVYYQSSQINRTLLSARSNIEGFYKLRLESNEDSSNALSTIPIIIIPKINDNKLMLFFDPCPKWNYVFKNVIENSAVIRNLISENAWLLDYLTIHSGKKTQSLYDIGQLYNIFYIQHLKNFTLPEWTKRVYPGELMETLTAFSYKTVTFTDEMKRLRAGPLLKEILTHIRYKIEGRAGLKYRKLFAYSAHDATIAAILDTLGVFDVHIPPYAAAIVMELWKNSSSEAGGRFGGYYINISYRNDTSRGPYVLHPPGCNRPSCDMESFQTLVGKFIPKNWTQECSL